MPRFRYHNENDVEPVYVRATTKKAAIPLLEQAFKDEITRLKAIPNLHFDDSELEPFDSEHVMQVATKKDKYGPRPTCCKKAASKKDRNSEMPSRPLIMLWTDFYAEERGKSERPPHWTFKGIRIKYCPWCRARLPKVEKVSPPYPTAKTGDGNYCETCSERLDACECNGPSAAYRIVERIKNDPQRPVMRPKGS